MESLLLYIPVFLALYVLTSHFLHRIQNIPPTPLLSLPVLGHLYLLKTPLQRTFARLSDRYGPILFLQLGSRPVVIVSSPSTAEECLTKNDISFANRPRTSVGRILGYNNTSLVWASYGDHWRNLRRISSLELLSTHRLHALSDIRRDEVRLLIKRLAADEEKRLDDFRVFDAKTTFVKLTLNIMMRMIAGKRYYDNDAADLEEVKRFLEFQAEITRIGRKFNLADFLPFIRFMGGSRALERDMAEVQRKRDGFIQSLIEQHKRKMEIDPNCRSSSKEGDRKTLIEVLLSLQQAEPEYYTDEIIRSLMLVQLLAGTETTVNTMEWALSLLLNHPEVLRKAQAEIDERVGNTRLVDESDLPQLPYLQSVITETLRKYPPVPTLLPHESSEDCWVGGYRVPRGTMLLINAWGIQNDPKVWVDPEGFRPERFMEIGGPRDGFRSLPFGSGRRGCPGEGLAMRVVGLTLGSLVQCFDWERPSEKMTDMTEGVGIILSKAIPLRATCRPRRSMVKIFSDQI
ncbi:Cytochrome P450, E-class, group I [Parasponia andersonii]|uniref:Cytochrome P450, E-class, group I n=1 Tax=Parasponia andersonii TaxID=3476 RepID=A0A2P5BZK9_PARAD|nr:Cytochrome P450, E-class, group I [Parasponia andersonii]